MNNRNLALEWIDCSTFDFFALDQGNLHLARGRVVLMPDAPQAEIHVSVEIPERWPDCFILTVQIENRSDQPLLINCLSALTLDLDPVWGSEIWSMQGTAVDWGQDFAFPLPDHYFRSNFLGHRDYGEGGGIP